MERLSEVFLNMNTIKPTQFLTLLSVALLLSACGLISNIIGERQISNPFSLDGQRVPIVMEENGLAVQAEGGEGHSFSFDDRDFDLRGFGGDYIKSEIGFAPQVMVTRPLTGNYPASFTMSDMSMTFTLSDEQGGGARSVTTVSELGSALTFDRGTCSNLELNCLYLYDESSAEASGADLAKALTLTLGVAQGSDADLKEAIRIIQLDGDNTPNTGTLSFALTTDSTPDLAGSTLTITLREGKSVVKL